MQRVDVFCERCGTLQPKPEATSSRSAGQLARRVLDAVGLIDSPIEAASDYLRLCLECRGYTCPACWNDPEGKCQTCAPLPEPEPAPEPVVYAAPEPVVYPALEPAVYPALEPAVYPALEPATYSAPEPTFDSAPWPDVFAEPATATPNTLPDLAPPEPEAEPEPIFVAPPEPEAEPEPVLVAPLEPEPVVVASPEPEAEPPVREPAAEPVTRPAMPRMPVLPLPPPRAPTAPELPLPSLPAYPVVPHIAFSPEAVAAASPAASAPAYQPYLLVAPHPTAPAPGSAALRPCSNCQLTLSARAHFCRRCGTAQPS